MRILFSGLPGSGKTTQAKKLAEYLKIPLIGTGELLRKMSESGDIPEVEKQKLISGDLVDDQLVADLVKKRLQAPDCQNGFIMDGYPRSIEQLGMFDPGFDLAVYLEIDDAQVKQRLLSRGRIDDTAEAIDLRFKIYHAETKPLIEHYRKLGTLKEIDGLGSEDEVYQKVIKSF